MQKLSFDSLNTLQRQAVETLEGPVLIIAGPGTGKTTILTYRIANILQSTDTKPEAIFATTYTEAGVFAMKTKLAELIGKDAYRVQISTIHGFANSIIQDYREHFMALDGGQAVSDLERIQIAREILDAPDFGDLSPAANPDMYVTTLLSLVSTMKKERLTGENFAKIIEVQQTILESMPMYVSRGPNKGKKITDDYDKQKKYIAKLHELSLFYDRYQVLLAERRRYDYDDMILAVLNAFRSNPELLASVQERFEYFLVDEYQDTNESQNELIFSLASYWGEGANIFAVGDDDQSIYRFQGASVKNIQDFLDRYPKAAIITLKENYRSQQTILDASRAFIRNNSSSIEHLIPTVDKALISKAAEEKFPLALAVHATQTAENIHIADKILELMDKKVDPSHIAVLVRDNKDMDDIIDIFQHKKVPYVRKGGNDVLKNKYVRQILTLMRITNDLLTAPSNDSILYTALHYKFFDVPKVDVIKFARETSKLKEFNLWDAAFKKEKAENDHLQNVSQLSLFADPVEPGEKKLIETFGLSEKGISQIEKMFELLSTWAANAPIVTLSKVVEDIINDSGMLSYLLSLPEKYQQLNAVNSFFTEVKNMNTGKPDITLEEFLEAIDIMEAFRIRISERDIGLPQGGVHILTAHSSKGLEYDYTFIPKLYYKKWDNKMGRDLLSLPTVVEEKEAEKAIAREEERRLFYVAMTRARKQVFLSYAESYDSGFGKSTQESPSQFLSEIPQEFMQPTDTKALSEALPEELGMLLKSTGKETIYINTIEERDLLKSILKRYSLSPTNLNTYLYCPMEFLLNVVLRTPKAMQPALVYGNAYHKALEIFYANRQKGISDVRLDTFLATFESELSRYPIRDAAKQKLIKKGTKNLTLYYERIKNNDVVPIKIEHSVRNIPLSGAMLNGRIDRIDLVDKASKELILCDYKTGGAIGDWELKKKPVPYLRDNDKGQRYYNQLLFYKILIDHDPLFQGKNANAVQGKLIFVDPVKEDFVERTVDYERDDVEDMKSLIIDVWNKIQSLEFPKKHKDDECWACAVGN